MEAEQALSLEPFNEHYVIVYGNKEKYNPVIELFQGKWYQKFNGWLVPKNQERKVEKLCITLTNSEKLIEIGKNVKNRKDQTKYRRATSDDEDSSSPSPEHQTPRKTPRKVSRKKQNLKRSGNRKQPVSLSIDANTLLMSESSDSEEEGSSDSDFPNSQSPRNYQEEFKRFLKNKKKREKILQKSD